VVVGVELGAGRATLSSPPGVSSVADRRWHAVSVVLGRSVVQLTVDDVFRSRATLPGDFAELNVDVGLRLGDARFAERPPLTTRESTSTSFRGCLRSVLFNDVDVLAASRRATSERPTAVSWDRSEPLIHGGREPRVIDYRESRSALVVIIIIMVGQSGSFV